MVLLPLMGTGWNRTKKFHQKSRPWQSTYWINMKWLIFVLNQHCFKMDLRRQGDKTLTNPLMILFSRTYMRHQGSTSYVVDRCPSFCRIDSSFRRIHDIWIQIRIKISIQMKIWKWIYIYIYIYIYICLSILFDIHYLRVFAWNIRAWSKVFSNDGQ